MNHLYVALPKATTRYEYNVDNLPWSYDFPPAIENETLIKILLGL